MHVLPRPSMLEFQALIILILLTPLKVITAVSAKALVPNAFQTLPFIANSSLVTAAGLRAF